MARIIVVRGEQTSLMLRYRDFPIKVDGEPLGDLAVGRFAYLDREHRKKDQRHNSVTIGVEAVSSFSTSCP